jgi:hypothetical protein
LSWAGHPAPSLDGLVDRWPSQQGAAPSRDPAGDQQLLAAVEQANQGGEPAVITDNLQPRQLPDPDLLAEHPRIRQVFTPVGACWLNLHGAWWRRSRRAALAGQAFECPGEISLATRSRPGSSTPAPAHGCGAAQARHHATGDASSPTEFEEHSTKAGFQKFGA